VETARNPISRWYNRLWQSSLATLLLVFFSLGSTVAQEPGKLNIIGIPQQSNLQPIIANAWALYLDGEIDFKAAERLESYLIQNDVPPNSWAILNSPGGSLYGGIEIGNVIRKHELFTDVGTLKAKRESNFDYDPGGCYSACTLAYVGGRFRFLRDGSHFGIHRFAYPSQLENPIDVAQVTSASIVGYLQSMDIDPELFRLSTTAAPQGIYEPPRQDLERLNVVNNGFYKPKWSVESNKGLLYLKGERDTMYGINKFIMYCTSSGMMLHIIFDPHGHEDEALMFAAHSLVIDGKLYPLTPVDKQVANGWFNSEYILTPQLLLTIQHAKSVGLAIQMIAGAPVFLGFKNMPFEDGANKLVGLLNDCGSAQRVRH
jgi:hypothetical protein